MTMGWWKWILKNENGKEVNLDMWKRTGKINSDDLRHIADMLEEGYTEGELI